MVAKISCPFSSFTLNIAFDKASTIVPSCLINGCFDIQNLGAQRYGDSARKRKIPPFSGTNIANISKKLRSFIGQPSLPMALWSLQDGDSAIREHKAGDENACDLPGTRSQDQYSCPDHVQLP